MKINKKEISEWLSLFILIGLSIYLGNIIGKDQMEQYYTRQEELKSRWFISKTITKDSTSIKCLYLRKDHLYKQEILFNRIKENDTLIHSEDCPGSPCEIDTIIQ